MRPESQTPSSPEQAPAPNRRADRVRSLAEARRAERGALMPILHDIVAECGWIDRGDVEVVADVLNISVAEVHGVVSFYEDFRTTAPTTHRITLCRAEACQSVGAQALWDSAQGLVAEDLEVQQVFCLGNCALGPAGTVDGRLHGRLDDTKLRLLTEQVRG